MALLPKEYQEVEYLETSGTQYINTGVLGKNTIGFKLKFELLISSDEQALIGTDNSNYDGELFQAIEDDSNEHYLGWPSWRMMSNSNLLNTTRIFSLNYLNNRAYLIDNIVAFDGDNHITLSNLPEITDANSEIYVFALNANTTVNYGSTGAQCFTTGRLYSLEITDDQTIVRDFVPCYNKNTEVAGLYDRINGVFYINAGTGTFVMGPDISRYTRTSPKEIDAVLPIEYQEVDFIESAQTTHNDCIYTGLRFNDISKIHLEMRTTSLPKASVMLICAHNGNYVDREPPWLAASKTNILTSSLDGATMTPFYGKHDLMTSDFKSFDITFSSKSSKICSIGAWQDTSYTAGWQIKRAKIFDKRNVLVRDYIPCFKKSTGVAGFYNAANKNKNLITLDDFKVGSIDQNGISSTAVGSCYLNFIYLERGVYTFSIKSLDATIGAIHSYSSDIDISWLSTLDSTQKEYDGKLYKNFIIENPCWIRIEIVPNSGVTLSINNLMKYIPQLEIARNYVPYLNDISVITENNQTLPTKNTIFSNDITVSVNVGSGTKEISTPELNDVSNYSKIKILKQPNLIAENIVSGVTILGTTGTMVGNKGFSPTASDYETYDVILSGDFSQHKNIVLRGNFTNLSSIGGSNMFYTNTAESDLESIDIYSDLIYISGQGLCDHTNLTKLILRTNKVVALQSSFTSCFSNSAILTQSTGCIYVPDALVDQYKVAANWSSYPSKIKGISEL